MFISFLHLLQVKYLEYSHLQVDGKEVEAVSAAAAMEAARVATEAVAAMEVAREDTGAVRAALAVVRVALAVARAATEARVASVEVRVASAEVKVVSAARAASAAVKAVSAAREVSAEPRAATEVWAQLKVKLEHTVPVPTYIIKISVGPDTNLSPIRHVTIPVPTYLPFCSFVPVLSRLLLC